MSLGLEKILLTNSTQKEKDGNWFYSREQIETGTPSRDRGMPYDEEIKIRRSTVRFLRKLSEVSYSYRYVRSDATEKSNKLEDSGIGNYQLRVFATASVWFHRFFMVHPFQVFDSYEIAAASYYLATKAEDQPLSIGHVIACSQNIMEWFGVPILHSAEQMEEELKGLENILMQTLGFIMWVRHPYLYIQGLTDLLIGEKETLERIQQLAAQYVTDSLGTSFCIRIDPRKLAIFTIAWACKKEGFSLNNWKNKSDNSELTHWVQSFKLKLEDVQGLYEEFAEHVERDSAEKEDDEEHAAILRRPIRPQAQPKPKAKPASSSTTSSLYSPYSPISPIHQLNTPQFSPTSDSNLSPLRDTNDNLELPFHFEFDLDFEVSNKRKKIKIDHNFTLPTATTSTIDTA